METGKLYRGSALPELGWKVVSRSDIAHLTAETLSPATIANVPLVPYCLDFGAGTLLFSAAIDPKRAMAAEFHYAYLRAKTRFFVELPESSIRLPPNVTFPQSLLLFSPGRCGSTLLAKVIRALGGVCISEPDFYSQAALQARSTGLLSPDDRRLLEVARRFLVSPWMRSTNSVVLKMRSHANHAPMALLPEEWHRPKTLFLMRRFEPWCESRMRAFANDLQDNLRVYMMALVALRQLRQQTECLLLDFDEINGASLDWARRLAAFLGHAFDEVAVSQVMNEDSQAGTPLAKNSLVSTLPPTLREEIRQLWHQEAPSDLLAETGLAHYGSH